MCSKTVTKEVGSRFSNFSPYFDYSSAIAKKSKSIGLGVKSQSQSNSDNAY